MVLCIKLCIIRLLFMSLWYMCVKEMYLRVTEKLDLKKVFSYLIIYIMLDLSVTELRSIAKNRIEVLKDTIT